jgi:uracil-DNA glycosylase
LASVRGVASPGQQALDLGAEARQSAPSPARLSVPLASLLGGGPQRLGAAGDLGATPPGTAGPAAGGPLGDWHTLLLEWQTSPAGRALIAAVDARVAAGATVFPPQVFRAFELTPLARTRVVILGQDPYHGAGQAEGLAFSVAPGQRVPPSLRNIHAELARDLGPGHVAGADGSLMPWAERGVLLLNSSLTVEEGLPASHAKLGWAALTDAVITALAVHASPKVFLLWGAHAQAKAPLIESAGRGHALLQCNHPSPLSARRGPVPFIGCGHFSQANDFLRSQGADSVDWFIGKLR